MEEYVKETKIQEINPNQKETEILKNLKKSQKQLELLYNNIKYAEGKLIDYYTYQIKAEEAKYDYLLKQIKNTQRE